MVKITKKETKKQNVYKISTLCVYAFRTHLHLHLFSLSMIYIYIHIYTNIKHPSPISHPDTQSRCVHCFTIHRLKYKPLYMVILCRSLFSSSNDIKRRECRVYKRYIYKIPFRVWASIFSAHQNFLLVIPKPVQMQAKTYNKTPTTTTTTYKKEKKRSHCGEGNKTKTTNKSKEKHIATRTTMQPSEEWWWKYYFHYAFAMH